MFIGYARVSRHEQNLDLQRDALTAAGCKRIFTDKITGVKEERKGLSEALSFLRDGDTLVVWRLDRLGRSLKHLIEVITNLEKQGIGFKSLTENIDTMTSGGKLIFHIFGALAEFERNLIRERTIAGLEAARARGRHGGPHFKLNSHQIDMLNTMYRKERKSVQIICKSLHISRATFYRYLQPQNTENRPDDKQLKNNEPT